MAGYERKYYDQVELWERDLLSIPAERERIISTIELIPSDVQTILDVGCGNGTFLNVLPNKYQAVGLDSSQEALKYVKTKAIHGDIAALPFGSASFDWLHAWRFLNISLLASSRKLSPNFSE